MSSVTAIYVCPVIEMSHTHTHKHTNVGPTDYSYYLCVDVHIMRRQAPGVWVLVDLQSVTNTVTASFTHYITVVLLVYYSYKCVDFESAVRSHAAVPLAHKNVCCCC